MRETQEQGPPGAPRPAPHRPLVLRKIWSCGVRTARLGRVGSALGMLGAGRGRSGEEGESPGPAWEWPRLGVPPKNPVGPAAPPGSRFPRPLRRRGMYVWGHSFKAKWESWEYRVSERYLCPLPASVWFGASTSPQCALNNVNSYLLNVGGRWGLNEIKNVNMFSPL